MGRSDLEFASGANVIRNGPGKKWGNDINHSNHNGHVVTWWKALKELKGAVCALKLSGLGKKG